MDAELKATYTLGRFHGKLILSQLTQLRGCLEFMEAHSFLITQSEEMPDEAGMIAEATLRSQAVNLSNQVRIAVHSLCNGVPPPPDVQPEPDHNVLQLHASRQLTQHQWARDVVRGCETCLICGAGRLAGGQDAGCPGKGDGAS